MPHKQLRNFVMQADCTKHSVHKVFYRYHVTHIHSKSNYKFIIITYCIMWFGKCLFYFAFRFDGVVKRKLLPTLDLHVLQCYC